MPNPKIQAKKEKGLPDQKRMTWTRSIGYFLVLGIFGLFTASIGPIIPTLAVRFGVPIDKLGIIFTLRAFGFMFGSILGGIVYDRRSGHPIMAASLLAVGVLTALVPVADSLAAFSFLMAAIGLFLGINVVGASTFIVWEHPENTGAWVTTQGFINGVGAFISPIVVAFFIDQTDGFEAPFWIYAGAMAALGVYLWRVSSPVIRSQQKNQKQDSFGMPLILLVTALLFLIYVGSEVSYSGWVFSIAESAYGLSPITAGTVTSLFWGGVAVGRILGIPLYKWLRVETILYVCFMIAMAALALMLLLPQSSALLWVGTVLFGLGMSLIFPSLMTFADQHLNLTGKKTSVFFIATSLGGMTIPFSSGLLFSRFQPHAVFLGLLAGMGVALGLFRFVARAAHRVQG